MGFQKINGTPWHVGYVTINDDKRHKSRCRYYVFGSNECSRYNEKCRGSSHCKTYDELSAKELYHKRQKAQASRKKTKKPEPDEPNWF